MRMSVCVFACVCLPPRLLITSGVMWHDMDPMTVVVGSVVIALMHVIETNLIRVSYHCISHYFHYNGHLKQLYISNTTKHFSYKGGCGVCGQTCIEALKEELDLN